MRRFVLLLTTAVAAVTCESHIFDFLEPKKVDDGVSRVKIFSDCTLDTKIVFVTSETQHTEAEQIAKLVEGRYTPAVEVCLAKVGDIQDATEGQIFVFKNNKKIKFNGLRQAPLIVKFLQSLNDTGVKPIQEVWEKETFQRIKTNKIVGYFTVPSAEYGEFRQAEALFGNQIPFYAMSDPLVAKSLSFNVTGQIMLFHGNKQKISCPKNPASLVDIQQLIALNKETLIRVTEMNVFDPTFKTQPSFILLTDTTPLSNLMLKAVLKSHYNKTTGENFGRVLWLDTTKFSTFDLSTTTMPGLTSLPAFGFYNPETTQVSWMNLATLNMNSSSKTCVQENQALLKTFMESHVKPVPTQPVGQKTEL